MPQDRAELMRALYGEHAAALWRYAMTLTGDRVQAESVVGETLLRATRSRGLRHEDDDRVREQLFAVARGIVADDRNPDPDAHVRADAVGEPPPDLLPTLLGRTRPRRRWGAWIVVTAGLAAAVAAIVLMTVSVVHTESGPSPDAPQGPSAPVTAQPMEMVAPGPLTADVSVIPQEWGSRIDVVGRYQAPSSGGYGTDAAEYELVLTDHTGATTTLATWTAVAGETVTESGSTPVPMLWVDRVEIRSGERTLLSSSF